LYVKGKWISKIQEYDLELKPSKLVKGQGLDKLVIEGNERALTIGNELDPKKTLAMLEDLQ
jgi:hypothetical protein